MNREWYINADTRTNMIFNWRAFLKQSIPFVGNKGEYDEFGNPIGLMAYKIVNEAKLYSEKLTKL